MGDKTLTRMDLSEAVFREVGLSRNESAQPESRWCRADSNPEFFITGFQIYRLNKEYKEYIQQLIEDFSIEESMQTGSAEPPACNLTATRGT